MRKLAVCLCLAALLYEPATANRDLKAQRIVAYLDRVHIPKKSYVVDVKFGAFVNGAKRGETLVRIYARRSPTPEGFDFLFRCLEPPQERAKVVLKKGKKIWFYDSRALRPVQISAQQAVLGHAWIFDALEVRFAESYTAEIEKEELIFDAERRQRQSICLKLVAKNGATTMPPLLYTWVDKTNYHQIKREVYALSGKLLRISFFTAFKDTLGEPGPTRAIVIDRMRPDFILVIDFSGFSYRDLPEHWFREEFMPHVVQQLKATGIH
ncbi:MAG TPA: outer membrane lipoprotein-sorting protein [Acidobacteriota bacterium]|jgi:hypothetical protein|nr:outer membrane lipoprotein-sorting protein [Acidobacteriota bacterium]